MRATGIYGTRNLSSTATPREDVDRSTYDLFQLEGGEPNFAYELDEAVEDKFLVPYIPVARTIIESK